MIALFDLDDTLLEGDSNTLWAQFFIDRGLLDAASYHARNRGFEADYGRGTLDIGAYLAFTLEPLRGRFAGALATWQRRFVEDYARARLRPGGPALLREHRARGHVLLLISATNRFFVEPLASELGMDGALASEPELAGGRFTGRAAGTPCFGEGKVVHFERWLAGQRRPRAETWFYSDSHNDLPLLERVDHPVVVDPDERLARVAADRGWRRLSLRAPPG